MTRFLFLLLSITIYIAGFGQNDTLYFIGEARWAEDVKDKIIGERIPFDEYRIEKKYRISSLNANNVTLSVRECAKEAYYNGSEVKCVELKIGVPKELFKNGHTLLVSGWIDVDGETTKLQVPYFEISWPTFISDDSINATTYKFRDPVRIGYPEEVAVNVITAFINNRLHSRKDSDDDYAEIINRLENSQKEYIYQNPLPEKLLMDFYKLRSFIEPYIKYECFWNKEARKLYEQLGYDSMRRRRNEDILSAGAASLIYNYDHVAGIYREYFNLQERLKVYYSELELILFLKTPSQLGLSSFVAEKQSPFHFVGGTGLANSFNKLYSINISPVDTTVQFQRLSRASLIITAGGLFHLSKVKSADSVSFLSNPKSKGSWTAGIFLHYYMGPNLPQTNLDSRLALGLGFGRRFNDFAAVLSFAVRKLRYPRSWFVDQYRDQNKQLIFGTGGSPQAIIDINNDALFYNKADFGLHLSLVYIFGKKNSSSNYFYKPIQNRTLY